MLVAVSGGKDSLAVWDMLIELGYQADGLYIGLGIGEYSDMSGEYARRFATDRGLHLIEVDLRDDYGFDIPTAAKLPRVVCRVRRAALSKRHLFDKAALDGGYTVLVTGHNLDDEAAVLFGNTLRWDVEYLARQLPVLTARNGFPKKVKPLVRLTERETAAWCIVRGIDYLVDECPMAVGNRHLAYKAVLNTIEAASPGSKAAFYLNFVDNMAPLLVGRSPTARELSGAPAAALPPRVACARSAIWWRRLRPRTGAGRAAREEGERLTMNRPFAYGDKVLLARHQAAPIPHHAGRGCRVPQPQRLLRPQRDRRPTRGRGDQEHEGLARTPRCARRSKTSWWRCRAARRSSIRRTSHRSACWPTSARVCGCSRAASAPERSA